MKQFHSSFFCAVLFTGLISCKKISATAQRYGITVWALADTDDWLYNNGRDFPLLLIKAITKSPLSIFSSGIEELIISKRQYDKK